MELQAEVCSSLLPFGKSYFWWEGSPVASQSCLHRLPSLLNNEHIQTWLVFSVIKKRSRLSLPVTLISEPLSPPPLPLHLAFCLRSSEHQDTWARGFLSALCLPGAATDGCSPERCYFRVGSRGRTADEREGEKEGPLLASSSHLDLQKWFVFIQL